LITLKKFNSNKELEINNSTELKELLRFCNPLMLGYYKAQLDKLNLGIAIDGMGVGVRIVRI